jgi:hypothetical protein
MRFNVNKAAGVWVTILALLATYAQLRKPCMARRIIRAPANARNKPVANFSCIYRGATAMPAGETFGFSFTVGIPFAALPIKIFRSRTSPYDVFM